jgi:hypothetical protein
MDKREEKRLDIAVESVKQQITLATAIIGASLAFSGQLTEVKKGKIWALLPLAFTPLALSIICGILLLMSISFYLGTDQDPLQQKLVRRLGILQNATFIISIILMVIVIAWSGRT